MPFIPARHRAVPARPTEAVVAHFFNLDKAVALVQRAGSTSMSRLGQPKNRFEGGPRSGIRSMPHARKLITPEKAKELGIPIIMWIRDPFERLASTHALVNKSFDNFWEHMLANDNVHWMPQTKLHTIVNDEFVPTKVYLFEDLAVTWAKEFPELPKLGVLNKKPHDAWAELSADMDPAIIERLREYYADDFALRKELVS